MRRRKLQLHRVPGSPGRTVAELMVALAIFVMVGVVIGSAQVTTARWYRSDQRVADVIRPVRDAVDPLSRDIEIATDIDCTYNADGTLSELSLTQKRAGDQYTVTYRLENNRLVRTERNDDAADPAATLVTRSMASGLTDFYAETAGTGRVSLRFGAEVAEGPTTTLRQIRLEVVSRMVVAH